ncbi:MAG: ATP-binding protein [Planctomycetota bacterium]
MFGLRQKLLLGFGGLLVIMTVIGVQSIAHLSDLGQATDEILQGDYQSVVACQRMKESLQLIDSGVELFLLGGSAKTQQTIMAQAQRFEEALALEFSNINLPGEEEKADQLRGAFSAYREDLPAILDRSQPESQRRARYLGHLRPHYEECIEIADDILQMNQDNMAVAGQQVKVAAQNTVRRMYIMLAAGAALSVVFFMFIRHWILVPLQTLTASVRGIEQDRLDQEVRVRSHDELADFGKAFNAMATHLRAVRVGDQDRLVRTQRTTQQAVDSLPDAVLVLSPEGKMELVNATAARLFGIQPGQHASDCGLSWLGQLWRTISMQSALAQAGYESAIQVFDGGNEKFFLPKVVPILDDAKRQVGITVVLADVTQLRKLDELKSGLLSTTSHELKTPLTSLQMAIHLLSEGRVGRLEPRQAELLGTARNDVDRLHRLVDNILDLSRIESGRVRLNLQEMQPRELVETALAPLRDRFQAQGLAVTVHIVPEAPPVLADPSRISLVMANLLSNALKYTPRGGAVRISAQALGREVEFAVTDTGPGIPAQYRERVFEKFFRVPEQNRDGKTQPTGAGLGLAIAKEVVEAHGGRIAFDSTGGQGCTFRFTLLNAAAERKET